MKWQNFSNLQFYVYGDDEIGGIIFKDHSGKLFARVKNETISFFFADGFRTIKEAKHWVENFFSKK